MGVGEFLSGSVRRPRVFLDQKVLEADDSEQLLKKLCQKLVKTRPDRPYKSLAHGSALGSRPIGLQCMFDKQSLESLISFGGYSRHGIAFCRLIPGLRGCGATYFNCDSNRTG